MNGHHRAPSFAPTASWENLRLRAQLLQRTREFFSQNGFLEVETPLLSADVVIDRHLEPIPVCLDANNPNHKLWLQTSPEAGMKRLMASGGESIYQITRSLRGGERGRLHNPEFTIVEWYRRGDSMDDGIQLLDELCQYLLELPSAQRLSYADAFLQYAHVDPHRAGTDELARIASAHAIDSPLAAVSGDRDAWLDLLLVHLIEPHLGQDRPVILYNYPSTQAALARVTEDDPPVARRFELYVRGLELANGYEELTDPAELRRRNEQTNRQRSADGKSVLPTESRLLEAMEYGLPACTGVAVGFDRIVMLAASAESIDQVLAFPIDRA